MKQEVKTIFIENKKYPIYPRCKENKFILEYADPISYFKCNHCQLEYLGDIQEFFKLWFKNVNGSRGITGISWNLRYQISNIYLYCSSGLLAKRTLLLPLDISIDLLDAILII